MSGLQLWLEAGRKETIHNYMGISSRCRQFNAGKSENRQVHTCMRMPRLMVASWRLVTNSYSVNIPILTKPQSRLMAEYLISDFEFTYRFSLISLLAQTTYILSPASIPSGSSITSTLKARQRHAGDTTLRRARDVLPSRYVEIPLGCTIGVLRMCWRYAVRCSEVGVKR